MKLGIAGYGYVGMAHELIFKECHDIIISDPFKREFGNLKHADAIIVCVSTPQNEISGHCDVTNVCDVIDAAPDVPILIKSTISPEGWRLITDTCANKNVTFSPEYLRAAHWDKDIEECKDFYMGGASTNFWADLFRFARGNINVHIAEPVELILSKQLRNSFLALKVTYFNQVYDYCAGEGVDFESVRKLITSDPRIGPSHSFVTEERGFGGHCLPKDTQATELSADGNMPILKQILEYNQKFK